MSADNKIEVRYEAETNVSFGEVLFSCRYYSVVLLDEPVVLQPSFELATYGIYNRMTGVLEIELCVLPAAIHTAENFSKALEEFFPTPNVRDSLTVVGDISDAAKDPEEPKLH